MAINSTNFYSTGFANSVANLHKTERSIFSSIGKLATGERLVTSSEDPSARSLSNRFTTQLSGIRVATGNAEDGLSMLQVLDGAVNEGRDLLYYMRDFCLEAMNKALMTTSQSTILNNSFIALRNEVIKKAYYTTFNGKPLLSAALAGNKVIQIGPDNNTTHQITFMLQTTLAQAYQLALANLALVKLTSDAINSVLGHATSALLAVDTVLRYSSDISNAVGVMEKKIDAAINDLLNQESQTAAVVSRITDVDMASEISSLAKKQVVSEATTAVMAQTNGLAEKASVILGILDNNVLPSGTAPESGTQAVMPDTVLP